VSRSNLRSDLSVQIAYPGLPCQTFLEQGGAQKNRDPAGSVLLRILPRAPGPLEKCSLGQGICAEISLRRPRTAFSNLGFGRAVGDRAPAALSDPGVITLSDPGIQEAHPPKEGPYRSKPCDIESFDFPMSPFLHLLCAVLCACMRRLASQARLSLATSAPPPLRCVVSAPLHLTSWVCLGF
jgi:hypothetical protein